MLQIVSFAMSAAVLSVAITVIVSTVRAELPYIFRALGVDPVTRPPVQANRAPRVRVTRRPQAAGRPSLRVAA